MKIVQIDVDGHNFPNLALMRNTTNNTRQNRLETYSVGAITRLSLSLAGNLKITKEDER